MVPHSTGVNSILLVGVVPPIYVPAIEIVLVVAYPVPPVTTPTAIISKLASLVILKIAPEPDPLFVEGIFEYVVCIPTLDPVVLVTGNNKLFAGVAPVSYTHLTLPTIYSV